MNRREFIEAAGDILICEGRFRGQRLLPPSYRQETHGIPASVMGGAS